MKHRVKFCSRMIMLAAICFITYNAFARKGDNIRGVWQATPIVADGNNNDWPQPYPWYNEKSGISYAISNDRENLYITFKANDAASKHSFLEGDVTILLDTDGGKSQDIAIRFAKSALKPGAVELQDMPQQPQDDSAPKVMPPVKIDMLLQGFKTGDARFAQGANNSAGIKAAAGYDEYKALVWEAVIPFRSFFKDNITISDTSRKMSVGFIFEGMHAHMLGERPQVQSDIIPKEDGGTGSESNGHSGGGGRHGGGGGGGMNINGMGSAGGGGNNSGYDQPPEVALQVKGPQMPEKTFRTWQKIALAWKE